MSRILRGLKVSKVYPKIGWDTICLVGVPSVWWGHLSFGVGILGYFHFGGGTPCLDGVPSVWCGNPWVLSVWIGYPQNFFWIPLVC